MTKAAFYVIVYLGYFFEHIVERKVNKSMYPMKMKPIYKDYVWGGTKLNNIFNKNSEYSKIAESWELSCFHDGLSIVDSGILKNKALFDILKKFPSFVSNNFKSNENFPLIIKLIDAKEKLSVQVHPSDETADISKNQHGKAEMWYVIDCEKNSFLYMGFKENLSKSVLKDKILSGDICNYLNKVFVKPGDVFFIPPGTVHAIGSGILIAEIQQSSNTTFRMFDYNRTDKNGKKRQLHIDDAIRVCDNHKYKFKSSEKHIQKKENYSIETLITCKYFEVFKYQVDFGKVVLNSTADTFQALLFISGKGTILFDGQAYDFSKGDCYFIPAGMGQYEILGECIFLASTI